MRIELTKLYTARGVLDTKLSVVATPAQKYVAPCENHI